MHLEFQEALLDYPPVRTGLRRVALEGLGCPEGDGNVCHSKEQRIGVVDSEEPSAIERVSQAQNARPNTAAERVNAGRNGVSMEGDGSATAPVRVVTPPAVVGLSVFAGTSACFSCPGWPQRAWTQAA